MKVILPFINLLLLIIIIKCDAEDQKYYFQLYSSLDKNEPYLFYAYIPPSNIMAINTTEKNNCTIIDNSKTTESVIKNLSSVKIYGNELVIKTCFNPDILVEIKNATIYKKKPKELSNVKYCYSTPVLILNSRSYQNENIIVTYWIEYELENGKEVYTHKCILFYIKNQEFSEEIILKKKENFYSEKCITLRKSDIFCSINSEQLTKITYFIIKTESLLKNDNNHLVLSNNVNEKDVYQKIFSTDLLLYDRKIYYYDIFIIEYHNKKKNVTKLNFQLYNKYDNKIMSFEDANSHSPNLYIEKTYIEPDLFNMIIQKANDTIISYIMKVGKHTNYLLSRVNLILSTEIKNSVQIVSNFLRDDICSNPKYMQTNFMTSFINYNDKDKQKMKNKEQNYYKYQKDIVSLITCLNKDNKVEYEPKKIVLPQCLNILDELNDKSYHVIEFTQNKNRIELDIDEDPKYASLRNVAIQFYSEETEGNILINYRNKSDSKNYSYGAKDFNKPLRDFSHIYFTKTNKMDINKHYALKYRLLQSTKSEDNTTYTCHLSSDICELKFKFIKNITEGGGGGGLTPFCYNSYCIGYIDNINCKCNQCEDIEGMILDRESNECICDVRKGFEKLPDENGKCICKEGFSYYEKTKECLPNSYLEECKCFIKYDDLSLIRVYDDCPKDKTIIEIDGRCIIIKESFCLDMNHLNMSLWFKLKEYKFYFAKINDCVYIFDGKNLTLFFYSNREDCTFEGDLWFYFIRICLNKPEITGVKEYMNFLNSAKEYDPNATDVTIFKKVEKKDSKIKSILFNLVNSQSQENISDVILPPEIISDIKNISNISEKLDLLLFKADITRNDTPSTQVEYQFYNPIPSKIHQKIIFEKNLTKTNLRRLDDDDEIRIEITNDDFEVKLNLPIQWEPHELEIIEELYHQKHIFLFNSSEPFYLDVCRKFTTKNISDIYLQDRKEKYFINYPFCEEGCNLIDAQNYNSFKITCQCSLKIINDNYDNISFYEEEPVEEFNKTYYFPNIRVVGCINKIKLFKKIIDIINLALFGIFFITHLIRMRFYNNNNAFKKLIKTIESNIAYHKKGQGKDNNEKVKDDDEKKHKIKTEEETNKEKKLENNRIKAYDDDNDDIFEKVDEDEDENKSLKNNENEAPKNKDLFPSQNKEDDEDMVYPEDDNKSKTKRSKLEVSNHSNLISKNNSEEIRESVQGQSAKSSERELNSGNGIQISKNGKENDNDYIYGEDDSQSYQQIYLNRILDRFRYMKAKKYDHRSFCEMFLGMISNNCTIFFILGIQNLFESHTKKKDENKNLIDNDKEEKQTDFEEEEGKDKDTKVDEEKEDKIEDEKIIRIEVKSKNKEEKQETQEKQEKKEKHNIKNKRNIKNGTKKENEAEDKNMKEKPKQPDDGNDGYTRISVLILTIVLYIFVNIIIMTKGYSLHLYLRKDKEKFHFLSFLTNLFVPYLLFYVSILRLKQAVSIKEFMDEQYYRFFTHLSIYYDNKKKKKKDSNGINSLSLHLHNIEAKISKKKNEHQKGMKRIFIGGSILILLNWYLMSCFLGIYENSLDCLSINLFISILSSILVSLLVYLISASLRICALKKEKDKDKDKDKDKKEDKEKEKQKKVKCEIKDCLKGILFYISQIFNPQYKFFCFCCFFKSCFSCFLFKCLSKICSLICCCCFSEDSFEDYKEEITFEEREKQRERKIKMEIEKEKEKERKNKEKEKEKETETETESKNEEKESENEEKLTINENKGNKKKKEEQKEKEKNLIDNDDDDKDKKSYDTKKEKEFQSDKNSVSIFQNEQKFDKEKPKQTDMDESY